MYDHRLINTTALNLLTTMLYFLYSTLDILWQIPYSAKFWRGENFGEFGETNAIRQYFTQPNSMFTKVANVSYCKFVNIFLTKTLKRSIRQSFIPPKFCAIR